MATHKAARKEVKKIESHQRKHGETSEMKPSKMHTKAPSGSTMRADLMKKGVKAMGKKMKKMM